jgi:hypothetical protein
MDFLPDEVVGRILSVVDPSYKLVLKNSLKRIYSAKHHSKFNFSNNKNNWQESSLFQSRVFDSQCLEPDTPDNDRGLIILEEILQPIFNLKLVSKQFYKLFTSLIYDFDYYFTLNLKVQNMFDCLESKSKSSRKKSVDIYARQRFDGKLCGYGKNGWGNYAENIIRPYINNKHEHLIRPKYGLDALKKIMRACHYGWIITFTLWQYLKQVREEFIAHKLPNLSMSRDKIGDWNALVLTIHEPYKPEFDRMILEYVCFRLIFGPYTTVKTKLKGESVELKICLFSDDEKNNFWKILRARGILRRFWFKILYYELCCCK